MLQIHHIHKPKNLQQNRKFILTGNVWDKDDCYGKKANLLWQANQNGPKPYAKKIYYCCKLHDYVE